MIILIRLITVLCCPFIFRCALGVLATEINDAMKISAIGEIAKLPVSESVLKVSDVEYLTLVKLYYS